jgi:hypothetical protein
LIFLPDFFSSFWLDFFTRFFCSFFLEFFYVSPFRQNYHCPQIPKCRQRLLSICDVKTIWVRYAQIYHNVKICKECVYFLTI